MNYEPGDDPLSTPADIVSTFCLEEVQPRFLFRYLPMRKPDDGAAELIKCKIVHVESAALFYIQLMEDEQTAIRISHDLGCVYDRAHPTDLYAVTEQYVHPRIPVGARYLDETDLRWYRAVVVDVDENGERPVHVKFVDYGNVQQNKADQLMMLPVDMGNYPPLAMKCRLKGYDEDRTCSAAVNQYMYTWQNTTGEQGAFITISDYEAAKNQYVVRLFDMSDGQECVPPDSASPLIALAEQNGDGPGASTAGGSTVRNGPVAPQAADPEARHILRAENAPAPVAQAQQVMSNGHVSVSGKGTQTELSADTSPGARILQEKCPAIMQYIFGRCGLP